MKASFTGIILFITFLLSSYFLPAQPPISPLFNRLCKSWAIEKLEDNGQAQKADDAQLDYRLVFNADSTMMQGLSPDGFIPGKWKLDEKNMVITIKDTKTNNTYRLNPGQSFY